MSLILKDVKLAKRNRSYPWGDERLPIDIERSVDTTSVVEVMAYYDFMAIKTSFTRSHYDSIEVKHNFSNIFNLCIFLSICIFFKTNFLYVIR